MPKKILIVEDDESVLKLESILLSTKGYLVYGAMNGVAALNDIAVDPPDLIILDIMLPELDGFEVCKRIKMNPETRHIPIIFLSARNTSKDIFRGKQAGCDQYITKPFKSAKFIDAIKLLLEKGELHSERQGMLH